MRHTFHQAAVAEEHPGVVIDDLVPRPIERRGERFFRERHADGIGETLPERTGRRFDTELQVVLRMAGRMRAELAESVAADPSAADSRSDAAARTAASSRDRSR